MKRQINLLCSVLFSLIGACPVRGEDAKSTVAAIEAAVASFEASVQKISDEDASINQGLKTSRKTLNEQTTQLKALSGLNDAGKGVLDRFRQIGVSEREDDVTRLTAIKGVGNFGRSAAAIVEAAVGETKNLTGKGSFAARANSALKIAIPQANNDEEAVRARTNELEDGGAKKDFQARLDLQKSTLAAVGKDFETQLATIGQADSATCDPGKLIPETPLSEQALILQACAENAVEQAITVLQEIAIGPVASFAVVKQLGLIADSSTAGNLPSFLTSALVKAINGSAGKAAVDLLAGAKLRGDAVDEMKSLVVDLTLDFTIREVAVLGLWHVASDAAAARDTDGLQQIIPALERIADKLQESGKSTNERALRQIAIDALASAMQLGAAAN